MNKQEMFFWTVGQCSEDLQKIVDLYMDSLDGWGFSFYTSIDIKSFPALATNKSAGAGTFKSTLFFVVTFYIAIAERLFSSLF